MFDLPLNPPFRFSPCYLLADFLAQNFNRSTVIFYFFVRWVKLFLLKINDLENILKIVAQKLVYITYTMYICTINLKQEQNGNCKRNIKQQQRKHHFKHQMDFQDLEIRRCKS